MMCNFNIGVRKKKFIVTTKARNEINRFLRQEHDRESIKLGKEILTKTLRRLKINNSFDEFQNSYKKFGYSDPESLLKGIGTGIITVRYMFIKLRAKDDFNLNLPADFLNTCISACYIRRGPLICLFPSQLTALCRGTARPKRA